MSYEKWINKHTATLVGQVAVVTGGNSGIGFAAAAQFLSRGARVVLACRSKERGEAAVARLQRAVGGDVSLMLLDLANNKSIDAFAAALAARHPKIDIFLHCAGVYYPKEAKTADGYPTTVGVNYIGTVRLTELVLPLMEGDGRMIFTTSLVDRFGREGKLLSVEGYAAYARSKYLLSAYACRLAAARDPDRTPKIIAVHPGITATNLLSPEKTTHKPWFSRLGHAFLYLFTHTPEKAALTALLAAAGEVAHGCVVRPRGVFGISGYPKTVRFCRRVRRRAAGPLPFAAAPVGEDAGLSSPEI